jgi:branched-chain amino acid transport system substrate-binding protein
MSKPTRRTFLKTTGATGAAGMVSLAGCAGDGSGDGSDGGDANGDTTPTDAGDGGGDGTATDDGGSGSGTLTIGHITFLSGPVASSGTAHQRGAELGVERINEEGDANGVEFEHVIYDSEASPDTGVQRARRLLDQDEADVIVAGGSSAVAKALNQFLAQREVPMVAGAPQTPDITKGECQPTTFRVTSNIVNQQKSVAAACNEIAEDDLTTVASINPDYVFGQQSFEVFEEVFTDIRSDAEVVSEQFPAFLKGDYEQEIQAIQNADPDILHTSLFGGDIIAFIRQGRQVGLFEQVEEVTFSSPDEPALALETEMIPAICAAPAAWNWPDNERTRQFGDAYIDRHGTVPFGFWSMYGRASVDAIAAAVRETGGDTSADALVSAFEGLTFSSVIPDTTIRESDHHAEMEAMLAGRIGLFDDQPLEDREIYGFTDPQALDNEQVTDDDITCSM